MSLTREQIEDLMPDELEEKQWGEVMVPCDKLRALCDMALASLAAPGVRVPEGWVVVPVEPTPQMVEELEGWALHYERYGDTNGAEAWASLLSAAPASPDAGKNIGRPAADGHVAAGLTPEMIEAHYPSSQHQPDECEMCRAIHDIAKEALSIPAARSDGWVSDGANTFEKELELLINRHSQENASNTPDSDFILAQYLMGCLAAFNVAVQQRETWYGRDARPGAPASGEGGGR